MKVYASHCGRQHQFISSRWATVWGQSAEVLWPVAKGCNRCTVVIHWALTNFSSGSKPPVKVMGKQSVARRQPGRGSPMTAVTRTDAIRLSAGRRAHKPLRGSQLAAARSDSYAACQFSIS